MANKKISALTGASTPLAGTEVLPIVQSGVTVKVAVSDLTAGRAIATQNITTTSGRVQINYDGSVGAPMLDLRNTSGVQWEVYTPTSDNSLKLDVWVPGQRDSILSISNAAGNHNITYSSGNLVQGTAAKGINFTANTPAAGMTSQLLNWYEEGTWTPNQGAGLTVVGGLTATGTYTRIGRLVTVTGKYVAGTSLTIGAAGVVSTNLPFTALTESVGSITTNDVTVNGSVVIGGAGTTLYNAATITAKTQMFFTVVYPI